MSNTLIDGTGTGNKAKVDSNNRLHTSAVAVTEESHVNHKGKAFNINTGTIELTNAVDTPVLYLKNNESVDLIITAIAIGLGPTTGGSGGIPEITVIRNPTAGTIVSGATDVSINSNRNYGSPQTLTVDAYKGATGLTMTDGDDHILFYQNASGRLFAGINEHIPRGSSIGIKIKPQASNTSMNVYAALICHLFEEASGD